VTVEYFAQFNPQTLKDATLFFSRGTPNLPVVIPAMDHIDTIFTGYALPGNGKPPAIRAAVEIAKTTLNKYYSLTDSSELYRIAMGKILLLLIVSMIHLLTCIVLSLSVLHPGYKLEYFKNAGWDDDWVDTARALVRKQFDLRYASRGLTDSGNISEDVVEKPTEVSRMSII
jgi:hypothetical protein